MDYRHEILETQADFLKIKPENWFNFSFSDGINAIELIDELYSLRKKEIDDE